MGWNNLNGNLLKVPHFVNVEGCLLKVPKLLNVEEVYQVSVEKNGNSKALPPAAAKDDEASKKEELRKKAWGLYRQPGKPSLMSREEVWAMDADAMESNKW